MTDDRAWLERALGTPPDFRPAAASRESLPDRVLAHLAQTGWIHPGDGLLVACSGGLDSLVLLHLFRFRLGALGAKVEAAHFDHRMRPGSDEDATWMRGVARAWDVPLHEGRAELPPRGEAAARSLRYGFLDEVHRRIGARWIVTAHHADDQVETILFRLLRGTGLDGLRGIPAVRAPGILRPILPFAKEELRVYASWFGLRPREDPTNRSPRFTRNRIRGELIPLLEQIRPGAKEGLLRLAERADAGVRLLDRLLAPLVAAVVLERDGERVVLDRDRLLELGQVERSGVFRRLAASLGVVLSRAGTEAAMEFMTRGASGGEIPLGRVTLGRSFDRLVLRRRPEGGGRPARAEAPAAGVPPPEEAIAIVAPGEGSGRVVCSGRRYFVRWGMGLRHAEPGAGREWTRFDPTGLHFPLRVRPWRAGDRTRTAGGGKKVKKLFGELRVPVEERHTVPFLVDAEGLVLWIPGRHVVPSAVGKTGGLEGARGSSWTIGVSDAD